MRGHGSLCPLQDFLSACGNTSTLPQGTSSLAKGAAHAQPSLMLATELPELKAAFQVRFVMLCRAVKMATREQVHACVGRGRGAYDTRDVCRPCLEHHVQNIRIKCRFVCFIHARSMLKCIIFGLSQPIRCGNCHQLQIWRR